MEYFLIVVAVVAGYFFVAFFLLRLIAPYMGFGGLAAPQDPPLEIRQTIADLETRATSQRGYLEAAYGLVLDKTLHQWRHSRFKAGTQVHRLAVRDLREIWLTRKFIYCGPINYLLYTLLVKSKFFRPEDVKVRHVFLNFVPHQYLQVRVGEVWVDADPAGSGIRGRPLGTHASLFG